LKHHPIAAAPPIDRLEAGIARPLWSVMIPTYNFSRYLGETLASVLAQDPGPEEMQIEVIDDGSTRDDPEPVIRAFGSGRIALHRNPRNLGLAGNFNECIRRARGRFVHILHSDDSVRPGFYAHAKRAVLAAPEIGAWTCRIIYTEESGLWSGFSELEAEDPGVLGADFRERQIVDQRIQFAGIMVRRSVYERLGGFRPELKLCLDWDMWKRAVVEEPIFYDPEPLACFRLHPRSAYARALESGATVAEERQSIWMAKAYVEPAEAGRLYRAASRMAAIRAIRMAKRESGLGHRSTALRLLGEALRCSLAPGVLARVLHIFPRALGPQLLSGSRPRPATAAMKSAIQPATSTTSPGTVNRPEPGASPAASR
jgi:hypothetical protein